MENYYPEVPKNWIQRNWKWVVPTGCFTLLILAGLFFTGIYFGITSIMKNSDVYKHSMEAVQNNKILMEKIGNHIESEQPISGTISTSNSSGNAHLEIPLKGSKGEGLLQVDAEMINNIWIYHSMNFYPKGSTTPIDLARPIPKE